MTRKRTRESLAHVLCEPCPVCQGRSELKTAQTVCYQILRELLRESRQFDAREFRILASQQVTDMFVDEESQSLAIRRPAQCAGPTPPLAAALGSPCPGRMG
jgi:ribonuclease G